MFVYKNINAHDHGNFKKKRIPHRDIHMISNVRIKNDTGFNPFDRNGEIDNL